jgi:DNA-binding LytR/AlgR family response regulator
MLRVLAVDDELPALEEISFLLREDPRIEAVTQAHDGTAALHTLSKILYAGERLDAIFLDIRMPALDGIDLSRLVRSFAAPPPVVFVTAHEDFAVTAYELGALDYLLKPVRPERLAESIRRIESVRGRQFQVATPGGAGPGNPRGVPSAEAPPLGLDEVIPVELGGRTRLVARSAVQYVEAQGDYVRLHTADGGYLVRMPLAALERRWEPAGFLRIHRSTLVAAGHIRERRFEDGKAVVQVGEESLPVSRRHTRQVRDLLVRRFRFDGAVEDRARRP